MFGKLTRISPMATLGWTTLLALALAMSIVSCGGGGSGKKKPKDAPITAIDKSKIKVDDELIELFAQGVALMKQGNYPQAKAIMNQIIAEDERLPGPVTNLGIIALKTGEEEKAIGYFKRAIAMDPEQAAAYNELAFMHREKGEFDEARGLYEQAIQYNPDFLLSYFNLGVLCDIYLRDPQCAYDNFLVYNKRSEPKDPLVQNWLDELERR